MKKMSVSNPSGESPLFKLSQNGSGRATGYSEFSKIVTLGRKTHVTWQDSEEGQFLTKIRTLDRDTGTWSAAYTVGPGYDNHGGPSLTADSKGHLHMIYYPHHHPFRYRRSARPNDVSEWTEEIQFGERCTYPSVVCTPDDDLILTCRERTDTQWVLNLYHKPPDGEWQRPRTLVRGNAPGGYARWQGALVLGPDGHTVHMSFMVYDQVVAESETPTGGDAKGSGYAVGYLRSRDGGKTWERSDGTPVRLPAISETIDLIDGVRSPTSSLNFRPGNIAVDAQGVPWTIYSRQDRQPFETFLTHPDSKGGWERIPLLPVIQQKWPERSVKTPGSLTFGQDGTLYATVTTVLVDKKVEEGSWGHVSAEVALLVSKDRGRTFHVFGVSRPDDACASWLPNLERVTGPHALDVPSLVYTYGTKGENNRQILQNEVVWCDVAALLQEDASQARRTPP